MIKIKASPIILSRVKKIDYRQEVYVYPNDLSNNIIKLITDIMSNGDSLRDGVSHGMVFINNGSHCIIGNYAEIEYLTEQNIDYKLDKDSGGRPVWGFIGCAIKTTDFIEANSIIKLTNDYYTSVYMKFYHEHWLDNEPATGPYDYGYNECDFDIKEVDKTAFSKFTLSKGYILEEDNQNDILYAYTMDYALKGNNIAFCSNADYNAHKLIISDKVQIVTVKKTMISMLRTEINNYQKHRIEEQKNERSQTEESNYTQYNNKPELEQNNDTQFDKGTYKGGNRAIRKFGFTIGRKRYGIFIEDQHATINDCEITPKINSIPKGVDIKKEQVNVKTNTKKKSKYDL